MTLLFEIAAGLVVYVLMLAFWPVIFFGLVAVGCFVAALSPEVSEAGRAVALVVMFGSLWLGWKVAVSLSE